MSRWIQCESYYSTLYNRKKLAYSVSDAKKKIKYQIDVNTV